MDTLHDCEPNVNAKIAPGRVRHFELVPAAAIPWTDPDLIALDDEGQLWRRSVSDWGHGRGIHIEWKLLHAVCRPRLTKAEFEARQTTAPKLATEAVQYSAYSLAKRARTSATVIGREIRLGRVQATTTTTASGMIRHSIDHDEGERWHAAWTAAAERRLHRIR